MKILTITLLLLFFDSSIVFGYSLSSRIVKPIPQHEEADFSTDVYEIEEADGKTVKLIYPKAEKPTLREIIYYHIIEKPYDSKNDLEEGPFTNSHGLQFAPQEEIQEDDHSESEEPSNQLTADNLDIDTSQEEALDMGEFIEDEALEPQSDDVINSKEDAESSATDKSISNTADETTPISTNPTTTRTTEQIIDENTTVKDDVKKSARNRLFGQVKERYQNVRRPAHSKSTTRQKRDVALARMPEPPRLPKMNYDALPEYVKKLIRPPKLDKESEPEDDNDKHYDDINEAFKEGLRKRMEFMFGDEEDEDIDDNDVAEDVKGEKDSYEAHHIPRTYGMNLTENHGVVWNDLFVDKGLSFEVGEVDSAEPDQHENHLSGNHEDTDLTDDESSENHDEEEIEHSSEVLHPTESKPINHHENDKDKEPSHTGDETEDSEEYEDIYIHKKPKPIVVEDLLKEEEKPQKQVKPVTPFENEKDHKESTTENVMKLKTNSENSSKKPKTDKNEKNDKIEGKKEEPKGKDENGIPKKGLANHEDLFQELMDNEPFWTWLSEWTNTYMEVLVKQIKRMVHDEVGRQMKKYSIDLKKEILEEHEKVFRPQLDEDSPKGIAKNSDKEKVKNKTKASKDEEKPSKEKKKHEDNEPVIKNDTLFIDGIQIPITHSSNLNTNEGEKHKDHSKHKKEDKHKHEKGKNRETNMQADEEEHNSPIIATAHNIFGNAAGNEKVTNVFIFMQPDEDTEDDYEDESEDITKTNELDSDDDIDIDHRFKPDIDQQKDKDTASTTTPKPKSKIKSKKPNNKTKHDKKDKDTPEKISEKPKQKEPKPSNPKTEPEDKNTQTDKKQKKDEPVTEHAEEKAENKDSKPNEPKKSDKPSEKDEKQTTSDAHLETNDKTTHQEHDSEKGEDKLEKGKDELEKGKDKLEKEKDKLEKGKDKLEKEKDKLEKGEDKLQKGKDKLEKEENKLEKDEAKLDEEKGEDKAEREENNSDGDSLPKKGEMNEDTKESEDKDYLL